MNIIKIVTLILYPMKLTVEIVATVLIIEPTYMT
jgi:hypothetical protein